MELLIDCFLIVTEFGTKWFQLNERTGILNRTKACTDFLLLSDSEVSSSGIAAVYAILIIIIIYGNLYSALFILEYSKAIYTENKDNDIKHVNTVQLKVNQVF